MKKTIFVLISLLCLMLPVSCGAQMPEEEIPVSADTALMGTGVVYCTDGKYLIPVSMETQLGENVPQQLMEGMQTVSREEFGLSALLPESAEVSVILSDRIAKVSITGDPTQMNGDQIVCSAVSSLTQYGGIDAVQFSVNGLSDKFGSVDISQPISEVCLNPAYEIGDLKPFQVYFKNSNGLVIPMTKATDDPSAEVYVKALMTVPKSAPELQSLFPEGTKLNSAVLSDDGTLSLDFSGELYGIAAMPEAEEALISAINATCLQLEGVKRVDIFAEGVEYITDAPSVSVFANSLS